MGKKRNKRSGLKNFVVYAVAAILIAGVTLGATWWLADVDVPISYEQPFSIQMSESETDDYGFQTVRFKDTVEWAEADFEENTDGTQYLHYHQHVRITNPEGTRNVAIDVDIEEPTGWNENMGFTILDEGQYDPPVEPGDVDVTVDEWGSITHSEAVPAGETVDFTVVYTLGGDAPEPNTYDVRWTFQEGESTTVEEGESIQEAINDASPGTTIFVEAENNPYEEQLTIDKDLSLIGIGDPIIRMPDDPDESIEIDYFDDRTWAPVIFVQGEPDNTIDVMIDGFQIDGNGHDIVGDDRTAGVLMEYVEGTVQNMDLYNFGLDTETFGILGYTECDLIIQNNHVIEFGRGAIGVSGENAEAQVIDNVVEGPDESGWGPNGVQIGYGATGIVRNNEISNIGHPNAAPSPIGIVESSGVLIDENTITDSDGGIDIMNFFGGDASTNNIVRNNNVINTEDGIGLYAIGGDVGANTIIDNEIEGNGRGLDFYEDDAYDIDTSGSEIEGNTFLDNDFHVDDWTTDEKVDLETILEQNNFPDEKAAVIGNTIRDVEENTVYNQDTGEEFDKVQAAIDHEDTETDHTILVGPGTYNGFDANVEGLEIVAVEPRESVLTNEIVTISAQGVTLDGFLVEDIPTFETAQDAAGILVTASEVAVRNNHVRNLDADSEVNENWMAANGIQVFNNDEENEITDITIENNLVEEIYSYGYDTDDYDYGAGSAGIKIQGNVRNVQVQNNEVRDIWSEGWSWGITVTDTVPEDDPLEPNEVTITMNSVKELFADSYLYGIAFGSEADASEVTIYENNAWTASDDDMDYGVENKDNVNDLEVGDNFWNTQDDTEIIYDPKGLDNVNLGDLLDDPVDGAGIDW